MTTAALEVSLCGTTMKTNHDRTCPICAALSDPATHGRSSAAAPAAAEAAADYCSSTAVTAEDYSNSAGDFCNYAEDFAKAADESSKAADRAAMRASNTANRAEAAANRAEAAAIRAERAANRADFNDACRVVLDAVHDKLALVPRCGLQSKLDFLLAKWCAAEAALAAQQPLPGTTDEPQ